MTEAEQKIVTKAIRILDKYMATRDVVFTEPSTVKNYLRLQLEGCEREVFVVMFVDSQHRLIAYEEVFFGSLDCAPVYPRIVVQKALAHNAAAVLVAHNHPSGVASPSRADRAITERLVAGLSLVDIKFLDHFIVGSGEVSSFAELGYL